MEIQCGNCQTTLRVSDEHVGRQARCPKCGNIQAVTAKDDSSAGGLPADGEAPEASAPKGERPLYDSQAGSQPLYDQANEDVSEFRSRSEIGTRHEPNGNMRTEFRESQRAAHRGTTILICSILGLLCTCPILSIAAWVMASKDLTAMNTGDMDPAGRDLTRTGFYLGLIGAVLWIALSFCVSIGLLLSSGT